jgi:hypothetical protein
MIQTIREFLRPTKSVVIATFLVIAVSIIDESLAVQSWPKETLFLVAYDIVFTPVDFIRSVIFWILSVNKYSSSAEFISFVLDILNYYILGCIVVYIIKLNKKVIKK